MYRVSGHGLVLSEGQRRVVTEIGVAAKNRIGFPSVVFADCCYVGDEAEELNRGGVAIGDSLVFERRAMKDEQLPGREDTWWVSMHTPEGAVKTSPANLANAGRTKVNGAIYDAVVTRTTTKAVEGTTCCKETTEVVASKTGFWAPNDDTARIIALAGTKVDPTDVNAPIEVKLRKWA